MERPAGSRSRPSPQTRLTWDGIGLGLATALCAWIFLSSSATATDAAHLIGTIVLSVSCALVARFLAPHLPTLIPAGLVGVGLIILMTNPGDVVSGRPLEGPFGYANATGAFYSQLTFAALLLVFMLPGRGLLLGLAAVVFVAVPLTLESQAAALAAIGLAPLAFLARGKRRTRVIIVGAGLIWFGALLTTLALGAVWPQASPSGSVEQLVASTVGARRPALWNDALRHMGDHAVFGVGVGRFGEASEVAASERDTRFAHNEFLELGAETGIAGIVLLVGIFAWSFARLALCVAGPGPALGALALAAVGTHASLDYILHFPAVVATVALLWGTASATRFRPGVAT